MDLTHSIEPKSDQLNAEDLLSGPRTVTIREVRAGSVEQPVEIDVAEFDRPFKPSKTVRRILVAAWGPEAANYTGRRMTLYRDPLVKFGGMDVGGIRVSHLSHIPKPLSVALTVTRGKRAPYRVEPLPDAPPVAELSPVEKLRAEWQSATPPRRKAIEAEVAALTAAEPEPEPAPGEVAVPPAEFDPTTAEGWPAQDGADQ